MKLNLHYKDALQLLLAFCRINGYAYVGPDEWPAVITHWLQDPSSPPIFGDEDTAVRWRNYLLADALARQEWEAGGEWWSKTGEVAPVFDFEGIPFAPPSKTSFRFIDLFAGIGGFRLALRNLGGRCVFSSEWDRSAKETYFRNYGEYPFGDIRQFTRVSDDDLGRLIPDHDILAAGFPCQPFSRAGVSARVFLGHNHGFACETQGTLFYDIVRIAKIKRPQVLFLENVRNLESHDDGRTIQIIRKVIEEELGYSFSPQLIDASSEVPQRRIRYYMVCFRDKEIKDRFRFPDVSGVPKTLESILEQDVDASYTISDRLWKGHIERTRRNLERGTGFTACVADPHKPAHTLVARYGKDGKECLIPQDGKPPRLLTPRECARLQGFPEEFILPDSRSPAYRQFGNSVAVPVVHKIAKAIIKHLQKGSTDERAVQEVLPDERARLQG